jgi:hypothetical protein
MDTADPEKTQAGEATPIDPEGHADEMAEAEAPHEDGSPGLLRRFFLMEAALREAETDSFPAEGPGFDEFVVARELAEAGEMACAPRVPLQHSDGTRPAFVLFHQALWWALAAQLRLVGQPRPAEQTATRELLARFEATPAGGVALGALSLEVREVLRDVLGDAWLLSTPDLPAVGTHQALVAVRTALGLVLPPLERRVGRAAALRALRALRWVGAGATAAALVIGVVLGVQTVSRGPNLAKFKPVTMSSVADGYPASQATDDVIGVLGVHSNRENKPWLTVDLQGVYSIKQVVVYNRTDCCEERVVPLIIEVSTNNRDFTQVTRRDAEFHTWAAKFTPVQTRYVRLRVDKAATYLNLNEVQIY